MQNLPYFSPLAAAYSAEFEKTPLEKQSIFHTALVTLGTNDYQHTQTQFGQAYGLAEQVNDPAAQILATAGYIAAVRKQPPSDRSVGLQGQVQNYVSSLSRFVENTELDPVTRILFHLELGMYHDENGDKPLALQELHKVSNIANGIEGSKKLNPDKKREIHIINGLCTLITAVMFNPQDATSSNFLQIAYEKALQEFHKADHKEGKIFSLLCLGVTCLQAQNFYYDSVFNLKLSNKAMNSLNAALRLAGDIPDFNKYKEFATQVLDSLKPFEI